MDLIRIIVGFLALFLVTVNADEGDMIFALDGMQGMMNSEEPEFDRDLYDTITTCFDLFDPGLMAAQDAEWGGMMDYAETGGTVEDPWLSCDDESRAYVEYNCTVQEQGNMSIFEPCDYASNIAYYGTMIEVCKRESWDMPQDYVLALVRAYSYLAQGSAFMHGSQTEAGHVADIRLNDLFAYIGYQAAVAGLEPLDSSIIHELSTTPRSKSAVETTEDLQAIYTDQSVEEWTDALNEMDVPGVRLGMCAYIVACFSLFLDGDQLQNIAETIISAIDDGSEDYDFCLNVYLPELEDATKDIVLDDETYSRLLRGSVGTVLKLVYGALWQEEIFGFDFVFSDTGNKLGAALLPIVNNILNLILPEEDFPHYNPEFQHGENVYPGEEWCNPAPYPHAKWHLQTGIALADFAHLSNLMNEVLLSDNPAMTTEGSVTTEASTSDSVTTEASTNEDSVTTETSTNEDSATTTDSAITYSISSWTILSLTVIPTILSHYK